MSTADTTTAAAAYLRGMEHLVEVVQQLSLARDLPTVQQVVRSAARRLVASDGATFVLREGDSCYYADEDAIAPLWKGSRFPMDACVSGWVMRQRQAVVIPDIELDPRVPADAYRPTFVKSLAVIPIRASAPIGAIGAYWAAPRRATTEEVKLLQALADSTSVAMESVALYADLERRVAERTAQLEAANRELESFSYSVSHDLRAPLRAIDGFSKALLGAADRLDAQGVHHLERIRAGAQRMGQLIDDLLGLSRVTRAELRSAKVDLSAAAREVADALRRAQPEHVVDLVVAETPPAHGDRRLLLIVLENLLGNAWKFTRGAAAPRVEFGAEPAAGSGSVFFVRDNGVGFDLARADKLFTPFQRFHDATAFEGSGIGLATVARVIGRHGGRVWAESRPGAGTTLRFTLPPPPG